MSVLILVTDYYFTVSCYVSPRIIFSNIMLLFSKSSQLMKIKTDQRQPPNLFHSSSESSSSIECSSEQTFTEWLNTFGFLFTGGNKVSPLWDSPLMHRYLCYVWLDQRCLWPMFTWLAAMPVILSSIFSSIFWPKSARCSWAAAAAT